MQYKPLGKTGVKISQICLGSNNFGSYVDEETAKSIIKKAIECGVNIIDTSNNYTQGKSETIIGRALKGDRDRILIATKVGQNAGAGPNETGLSRKHIMWQVSQSLERLQTDYIDVYYMHRFDPETPLEETLTVLDDLVLQGKILYPACSNFTADQMRMANEICERKDLARLVAVQPPYNLLNREVEKEILPYSLSEGISVISYSPLMSSFLTGKYESGSAPPAGSRGSAIKMMWDRVNKPQNFEAVAPIQEIAKEAGVSMVHLSLYWLFKNPAITSVITGVSRPEQIEDNAKLVDAKPPQGVLEKLDEVLVHENAPRVAR